MASDLQMTQHNAITWKIKTKLFKFQANEAYPYADYIVGFAGTADELMEAVDYLSNPGGYKKPPVLKNTQGLVLTSKGDIYLFSKLDKWLLLDTPYAVLGSGSMYALGAMEAGATPKEAVKVATKRDPYTGMGVKGMTF
jgi:hypothetical protein